MKFACVYTQFAYLYMQDFSTINAEEFKKDAKLIGGISVKNIKQIPADVLRETFTANPEGINSRPAACDSVRKSVGLQCGISLLHTCTDYRLVRRTL